MSFTERRLRVAGVEILVRASHSLPIDEFLAPLEGYRSQGSPIQVVHEFHATDSHAEDRPIFREYPGYDCRAETSRCYAFWRADSRGHVVLPETVGEPVNGHFSGKLQRSILESTLRLSLCLALPRLGALMLHASGAATTSDAFVFTGPSGAGKSTLFRLLQKEPSFPRPLGDEMIVLRRDPRSPTRWCADATPFGGECGPSADASAPLKGVFFLRKGTRTRITAVPRDRALPLLLRNVLAYVQEKDAAEHALVQAAALVENVPFAHLEFARDASDLPGHVAGHLASHLKEPDSLM